MIRRAFILCGVSNILIKYINVESEKLGLCVFFCYYRESKVTKNNY